MPPLAPHSIAASDAACKARLHLRQLLYDDADFASRRAHCCAIEVEIQRLLELTQRHDPPPALIPAPDSTPSAKPAPTPSSIAGFATLLPATPKTSPHVCMPCAHEPKPSSPPSPWPSNNDISFPSAKVAPSHVQSPVDYDTGSRRCPIAFVAVWLASSSPYVLKLNPQARALTPGWLKIEYGALRNRRITPLLFFVVGCTLNQCFTISLPPHSNR